MSLGMLPVGSSKDDWTGSYTLGSLEPAPGRTRMPFSPEERQAFLAGLQEYGWRMEGYLLMAPSGGLWFSASHLDWSPAEMADIFTRRGNRIEAAWPEEVAVIAENRQVVAVIQRLLCNAKPTGEEHST